MLTFVDDIPPGANVLVATGNSLDVFLHDLDQSGVVESTLRNPCGELAVPNEVVAVDLKLVLPCKFGDLISISQSEVVRPRLCGFPLHRVLRCDAEVLVVRDILYRKLIRARHTS